MALLTWQETQVVQLFNLSQNQNVLDFSHSVVSGVSLKAEATPVALRKLGDRVRDEWAKLYADNSEEEDSLQFPAPVALKF